MTTPRQIDPKHARQLIISKQHLDAAERPSMLDVVRDLGCLQLDPIRKVERPPQLILWSRLGQYDPAQLEKLRWEDRSLFEYWAHAASLVLTEDYSIHAAYMKSNERIEKWIEEHDLHELRQHILDALRENGPMGTSDFDDDQKTGETFSGWTTGRAVNRLMDRMWTMGEVMVVGREGNQRMWGLPEQFLPQWTPQDDLSRYEASYQATQRAIKALGVAKGRKHINYAFTRNRYWQIKDVLTQLLADERVVPVQIGDWSGDWLMHVDDLDLLERIESGEWQGKTTLLSPFDNLICDRGRTELIWDFRYRIEIYVPKDKREYGYYVLPILHGDRLIGRMDMAMDRKVATLDILATYAQDNATPDDVLAVREAVQALARFLGADKIQLGKTLPKRWSALRKSL